MALDLGMKREGWSGWSKVRDARGELFSSIVVGEPDLQVVRVMKIPVRDAVRGSVTGCLAAVADGTNLTQRTKMQSERHTTTIRRHCSIKDADYTPFAPRSLAAPRKSARTALAWISTEADSPNI
jgi:hypothetical protein